jgi:hypothetical protein
MAWRPNSWVRFLEEGVANTEVARPRHVQLIPSRYAIEPRTGEDGAHPPSGLP